MVILNDFIFLSLSFINLVYVFLYSLKLYLATECDISTYFSFAKWNRIAQFNLKNVLWLIDWWSL